ncbi:MAG: family 10 glycosylhydrolase [Candidatus Poribacteria bacterium]|nr:family 10 glycosylhydrolase [Candidatus Poribacteria bacterium]MDE0504535.1 family 10 glycosylhydrolase [Candidatus Poribacteria bacterium]
MIDIAIVNPSRSPAKCAQVGVRKIISTFYEGVLTSHEWLRCRKSTGAADIEYYGQYPGAESRDLLLNLSQEAHRSGVEVHPYSLVAIAGVWSGSRRTVPRTIIPDGRIPRFAVEHPEYMSRGRDGRSWLDWEVGEPVLGYDIGYMSLAYPEVREYVIAGLVAYAREFAADGVQLEFVQVLAEGEEVWPLGYDAPAIAHYTESHGSDPREIGNDDEPWTRLRAGYYTQLMRELREEFSSLGRNVEISVATEGVWSAPDGAYKLMLDWPAWVDEGLVDALHPRFWIIDPHYPLSYPNSETGSWYVEPARIEKEIATVKEVVGEKCEIYGTVLGKNGGGGIPVGEFVERTVAAAKAMIEAGSDGFGIYADDHLMSETKFWDALRQISTGRF